MYELMNVFKTDYNVNVTEECLQFIFYFLEILFCQKQLMKNALSKPHRGELYKKTFILG